MTCSNLVEWMLRPLHSVKTSKCLHISEEKQNESKEQAKINKKVFKIQRVTQKYRRNLNKCISTMTPNCLTWNQRETKWARNRAIQGILATRTMEISSKGQSLSWILSLKSISQCVSSLAQSMPRIKSQRRMKLMKVNTNLTWCNVLEALLNILVHSVTSKIQRQ